MKKIEDLVFTVTKILSYAVFFNCSKLTRGTRTAYFFLSSRWRFFVEQMTFWKKVSSSRDSSRCISSSWPWLDKSTDRQYVPEIFSASLLLLYIQNFNPINWTTKIHVYWLKILRPQNYIILALRLNSFEQLKNSKTLDISYRNHYFR